ncbi:histone acetyltransferase [Lunasporangiospora selenospora]|uniref:histone acetyltransferase n=1 Tax=Lunasporangiospora selenospora TaxID=979761 RepID=A0A9P6FVD9_9FUNG|nr:histone acetyltransferase [Lunasporangiospora selenospora]
MPEPPSSPTEASQPTLLESRVDTQVDTAQDPSTPAGPVDTTLEDPTQITDDSTGIDSILAPESTSMNPETLTPSEVRTPSDQGFEEDKGKDNVSVTASTKEVFTEEDQSIFDALEETPNSAEATDSALSSPPEPLKDADHPELESQTEREPDQDRAHSEDVVMDGIDDSDNVQLDDVDDDDDKEANQGQASLELGLDQPPTITLNGTGENIASSDQASSGTGIVYPPADTSIEQLSTSERMMKIARSCPCEGDASSCSEAFLASSKGLATSTRKCGCTGWKPKHAGSAGRIDLCVCGHKLSLHGGPWEGDEFMRRLKAAYRRDELLQASLGDCPVVDVVVVVVVDKGKLLDFDYDDEDIASLRKQIVPRDLTAEDDDDEPTLRHEAHTNGRVNGKSENTQSSTTGSPESATTQSTLADAKESDSSKHKRADYEDNDDMSLEQETKRIKIETDDDAQEPASSSLSANVVNGDAHATEDLDRDDTSRTDDVDQVQDLNGGHAMDEEDENMILLTGMKNLFQKQLPKMPREYIARLVYDKNHYSMAIVKAPLIVLGGITYRPFNHRKFAEIVFCAITSTEQVKGYGSHLMNHLKDYISGNTDVCHFLTYADNYAIGYFKKQGFTKEITLDRSIWMGYIKDYEGGTIMQCTMVPRVKYLEVNTLLQTQRRAVITKIKEVSKSHIIYPGLQDFKSGTKEVEPMSVPGIQESGWDPLMDSTPRVPVHGPHYNAMKHIVAELNKDASSWPFLHPVDVEAVTDYYSYIKDPMDLSTLESNVDADVYETLDDFGRDCKKIFDNCRLYNAESTPYVKCANKLEKVFKDKLKEWKET